jgi:UDP-N-acetyl-D-glucosamine dehydrogenase
MNLTVVGLGYVGLPLAIAAAKNGFSVTGFDIDERRVSHLNQGLSFSPDINEIEIKNLIKSNDLRFTSSLERVDRESIFVVAVPTPLNSAREPDLSMLESACDYIAKVINDGDLVINESTSFIGTVRGVIKPLIESKSGLRNLDFAVSPERIDPGNKFWHLTNTPRNVAGVTKRAGERALNFYSKFCESVSLLEMPEEAEAAKLIENTFRQVNIAFINEMTKLSKQLDFSLHNAIQAAATKPFGFMSFYPSIGVGGHCIPIDSNYLTYSAKKLGFNLEIVELANSINLSMPKYTLDKLKSALDFNFIGKKIQLVGVAYKPNTSDLRESPALELMGLMKELGANVIWHDPLVNTYLDEISSPLQKDLDLGLIVVPHQVIDLSPWENSKFPIFDLSTGLKSYGWPKLF